MGNDSLFPAYEAPTGTRFREPAIYSERDFSTDTLCPKRYLCREHLFFGKSPVRRMITVKDIQIIPEGCGQVALRTFGRIEKITKAGEPLSNRLVTIKNRMMEIIASVSDCPIHGLDFARDGHKIVGLSHRT